MSQPTSAAEGAAQNDTVSSTPEVTTENTSAEAEVVSPPTETNIEVVSDAKPEDPKPIKVEPVEDTIAGDIKVEVKTESAVKAEVKTEIKVEVKEEIGDKTVETKEGEDPASAPSMELEIDGDEDTEWVPPALPAPESAPPEEEEEEEPQPKPAHMTFLRFRNQIPPRQEVQQKSSSTPSLSPASAVAWLRWASKYQHPTELFHNPRAFSEGEKAGGGSGGSSGGTLSSNVDVVVPCTPLAIEPPKLAVTNYVPRPKRSPFSEPDLSESEAFNDASLKYRQLPSYHSRKDIVRAIQYNDVVIISGDTGCGKSTQVPQFVMDSGLLAPGQQVICTQPRRVAAITMAEYVAKERGVPLGKEVGYQIRFVNKACESTKLIYATTAIILRRLHSDPELGNIGCLIVDEVHERDVYSEFLLMVCRAMMMNTDPDRRMRLVLMSATLNADSFCDYFQVLCKETTLSPIHIEGRMFPVTEYFLEDAVEWTDFDTARPEGVLPAMKCPCSANGQKCVISKGGKLCKWAGYDPRECLVEIERGRCKDSRCKLMHAVVNQDKCPCISQKGSCPQGDGCRFRGHVSNECLTFLVRGNCRNNDSCKLLHRTIGPSQLDPDKLGQIRGKLKAKYGAPLKFKERTLRSLVFWKAKSIYFELIQELVLLFHKQANSMDASILVFLPGWADISRTMNMLNKASKTLHVLALHSLMSAEQQHLAFEKPPTGKRKVILSTNVAETSVTIDDVVYVIDSGVMKERVYDAERNISSLEVSLITRANAKQRKGRAGRCQQGVVVHLFPSYSLEEMREFPTPEMLSKPLEEVVLQCKVVLQGDMREVLRSSMARPSEDTINNAVGLLQDMNALTRQGKLTALGRAIAALPVHPMVAKMILFAAVFRVLKPAAVIAAFLSCKSPFVHTTGGDDDSGKKQFAGDVFSDHFAAVQAYARWRQVIAKGGDDQAFCEKYDLNYEAMDMAAMMVAQFVQLMRDVGYDGVDCQVAADPTADATLVPLDPNSDAWVLVKAALCAGFYPNVATINSTGGGQPQILNEANDDVQLHRSSVNANRREYKGQWVIHSDSMKLTRVNIMESTIVDTTYPLVFCNTLVDKGESILIDKWNAKLARPDNKEPLLEAFKLRHDILHGMKSALREHDLSLFPYETAENLVKYLRTQTLPCSSITGTSAKKAIPTPVPTEGAPEGAEGAAEPVPVEPEVVVPQKDLPLDQQPEDSIAGWENAPNSEHIFTNVMVAALSVKTEVSDKPAEGSEDKAADGADKPATDGAQPMDIDSKPKEPTEGDASDKTGDEAMPAAEGSEAPPTPKTPAPPKPAAAPPAPTPAVPTSKALHGNYKYPVADEPEVDTILPPMDLNYEETSDAINDMRFGSPCTPEFLLRWIHAGAASSEFVALCSYCTQELLGCPIAAPVYENLGIILRRLDCSIHPQGLYHDVESRKMALEFLVSEVLAMRVVETRIIEGKLDILNKVKAAPRATEREAAGACVSTLAESLGMDTGLDPIGLVREASPLIQDTLLREVHPTYLQPVLREGEYSEEQLNILATICAAMREDYTYRRSTMLTRLKVTIQSFEWTQKKDVDRNLITATRDAVMGACLEQPSVMPQHIFCIPAAVLVFWADKIKPSKATKVEARHKLVTIGAVPDRGGRTNTYNFEFRVETDVSKANAELKSKYNSGPAQQAQKGGAKPAAPPGRAPAAAPAPAAAAPTPAPSKGKERASSPVSKDRKKSRSPRRSPARKSPKRDKRRSRSPKRRSRSPKRGRSSDRKRERSSERHRSSDKYGTSSTAPYGYSTAGYDAATLAQYYYAAGYPSNYQYDNRR